MKKYVHTFFLLLVTALFLGSCKKDGVLDDMIIPKTSITFDDNIEKITGDYKKDATLTLKISGLATATGVQVTSTYSPSKSKDLGTLTVSNGTATLSVPASALRNTADGAIVGAPSTGAAGTGTGSRANNSYPLFVKAVLPDGTTEQRVFTAVLTQ
ncbi:MULTISPECIES: hypothetical protein [Hymenobacter]|uniref:Uncharacterized protein n=1 Tax=Hymenobacter jejuensis TaxID=2502781 RepID=A0A5B7ZWG3_9BACT|nr:MULTISPECIES: hypothetical protein [Hymenobacter]MBC6988448.1 hypothetical protein [Hymenobacter sp. BT491]QDA59197.1 hypothetical protein FHG12_03340 [Hymenobacter jejuensis]